jgi:hypothetical protein
MAPSTSPVGQNLSNDNDMFSYSRCRNGCRECDEPADRRQWRWSFGKHDLNRCACSVRGSGDDSLPAACRLMDRASTPVPGPGLEAGPGASGNRDINANFETDLFTLTLLSQLGNSYYCRSPNLRAAHRNPVRSAIVYNPAAARSPSTGARAVGPPGRSTSVQTSRP